MVRITFQLTLILEGWLLLSAEPFSSLAVCLCQVLSDRGTLRPADWRRWYQGIRTYYVPPTPLDP